MAESQVTTENSAGTTEATSSDGATAPPGQQTTLGISGRIAQRFQDAKITPLLALVGLLLGLFAILMTPREEEPQINVTFADVFIPFPGASASEVEHLVAGPAEQVLSEIQGVKHVYSVSRPGMALISVQFEVGEDRTEAIVRLWSKVNSNADWLAEGLGVGDPLIKPKGIDNVPILTATLWSADQQLGAYELGQVAHAIEQELKRVAGTRDVYTVGAPQQVMRVILDPQALASHGIDLSDLSRALQAGNSSRDDIAIVADNREIRVQAGTMLASVDDIAELVVGMHGGRPVYLREVARIERGPEVPQAYVWMGAGPGAGTADRSGVDAVTAADGQVLAGTTPAVTIAVAKQEGTNAVAVAEQVIARFKQLDGIFIPDGVEVSITRNDGKTADAKARKLITELGSATITVIVLVALAMGWRAGLVVGGAVIVTLMLTLFASWAYGFTLNRVSLFALIFSIGILVDDAIVVVENIIRHMAIGRHKMLDLMPGAVDEVGSPTILATFTVIAALLPMAFVSGLMGPYMSPIPINASMGMLISQAVAFVLTPWLAYQVLGRRHDAALADHAHQAGSYAPSRAASPQDGTNPHLAAGNESAPAHQKHETEEDEANPKLQWLFDRVITPFLEGRRGLINRWLLLAGILLMIGASLLLPLSQMVILKMLPFDNKSELQVVLDMPEGSSLEQTARVLGELGHYLETQPEVADYQAYAGTASPMNFNGLVRQYYLRDQAHQGDLQVNLVADEQREDKSHAIALRLREPLQAIAERHGGNAKIVEIPPGPPVFAPLVAEIYGIDYDEQMALAEQVRDVFAGTDDIVDIDDSMEYPGRKFVLVVDRPKAAQLGVDQASVAKALASVLGGEDMAYLHGANVKYAVPIRVEYDEADKADLDQVLALRVRSRGGQLVPLSEIVTVVDSQRESSIYHKDLLPVVYVTANMAGEIDSPLYGLFIIAGQLDADLSQWYTRQPENPYEPSIKWDGEWQVTYETFRDMGIAYAFGLVLIYLLVVFQFRSYVVPLIIMAPIPLTIIGILPGHALLGAQFTATSMIGMIALAGIIVRNSILLVDFINQQVRAGDPLERAVIGSAVVRTKPIVLTALATMAGVSFILSDPIFSGLAVSLLFGLFVSTVLTLVVIPVVYYGVMRKRVEWIRTATG
ncbi:efflux RND transporter permease subunit [Halochromatium salexigens]|uniref:Multidrug transporter AcrB n=1 Tax=Halochromatium salexigens TaxID=49447 RepID=A0AAJ0UG38_HALSE|nr:efflux RND transporter permease subunit [Halochromatium salexigens]MBK5930819.1 multidrug transporter AcrB [Halochromatium salexigens]